MNAHFGVYTPIIRVKNTPGGTTERNANDLKTRLLAFFLLSWTSNLATFDQHFDTFSPFLMLKKSVFAGYYNTKKEGKTFFSF